MKHTALVIAIAVALTAPAAAATKKKAAQPAETMSEAQKTNDASWRLMKGSLPIWLPSWAQPIYQQVKPADEQQPASKAKREKKAKAPTQ